MEQRLLLSCSVSWEQISNYYYNEFSHVMPHLDIQKPTYGKS
jgi:hypothetical protein